MNHNKLPIAESFYSLQGEGITTGYPAVFVRLAGCNLLCGGQGTQFDGELHDGATWRCDTIEVWMKGKMKPYDETLDDESKNALTNGAHLIITGGEPLMNQDNLINYINWVRDTFNPNTYVEIETNGTIEPLYDLQNLVNQWNCSPKLSNSGNQKSIRYKLDALKIFNTLNTQFKFVISDMQDFNELSEDYIPYLDKNKLWLMPAGENQELLDQSKPVVAELCKQHQIKMTNRLHIEIWNKKTGV